MMDEGSFDLALERIAEHEAQDISATWQAIKADLRKAGPFSKMILSFRESAITALSELVFADPRDAVIVAKLQNEIRRYVTTMEIIAGYRDQSAAVDANEGEVSEEEQQFLAQIEDPDD